MALRNCSVEVFKLEHRLDSGIRVSGIDLGQKLFCGPAYKSAPSRAWLRATNYGAQLDAVLHLHSSENLSAANIAKIGNEEFEVVTATRTNSNWTLAIVRRNNGAN